MSRTSESKGGAAGVRTVEEYLASLPEEKRADVSAVHTVVRKHMPKGYAEGVHYGMIVYTIPLTRFPTTYNGMPLMYAGLAANKNYCSLHLMGVYGDGKALDRMKAGFKTAGKKLDMGKACIRFKRAEDLPLDVIGESIASLSPDDYIALYEKSRLMTKAGARKAASGKSTPAKRARTG